LQCCFGVRGVCFVCASPLECWRRGSEDKISSDALSRLAHTHTHDTPTHLRAP
jgi:hypothetical protein